MARTRISAAPLKVRHVTIHGHDRAYVKLGSGPTVLLLHGLACDHTTWDPVIRQLARDFTVIAPDLLGHGASAKPRADYSIAGYANGMRDLLTVLGVESATVVGHSLGGGVAMQFAYQYPERTERLVLVSPGGIGPEVNPAIRAITLPGFSQLFGLLSLPGVREVHDFVLRSLGRIDSAYTRDLAEVADVVKSFRDPEARAAISQVVRACVDAKGQTITMADRAYLTSVMPMCVVWGAEDLVIPSSHSEMIRRLAPDAEVELIPGSGHFPHKDQPVAFVKIVRDFVRTTDPARHHPQDWEEMLLNGRRRPERGKVSGIRSVRSAS